MTIAILYTTISTALYYLASRAKITHGIWSRYPKWLDYWMLCSACFGFPVGVALAVGLGRPLGLDFLGLAANAWYTPVVAGLASMVWTPILGRIMVASWQDLMEIDDDLPNRDNVVPFNGSDKAS